MRERLKTLLLLTLVLCSVFLTARLLFGVPLLETVAPPAYEKLAFGELRPTDRQVLPVLRFGLQQFYPWSPGYAVAWESVRQLIGEAREISPERLVKPEPGEGGQLLVQFPLPVTPEVWGAPPLDGLPPVTAIAWLAADPGAFWYHEARGDWLRAPAASLRVTAEDLQSIFSAAPVFHQADAQEWATLGLELEEEILLPVRLPVLAPRSVAHEDLDFDKLLRSIFPNQPLVRRIEEREGAVIYTDGQKGLRLFDYGEVEFSSPKSEPGLERMTLLTALRRTAQYLQLMGGWPEQLFVGEVAPEGRMAPEDQGEIYAVTFFAAQHGMRLLQQTPPVRLRFSDRGVVSYNRRVLVLGANTGRAKTLVNPLAAAASLSDVRASLENRPAIREIFPAYYVPESAGPQGLSLPVWAFVCSDGRTAVVHGHTGQFFSWLE